MKLGKLLLFGFISTFSTSLALAEPLRFCADPDNLPFTSRNKESSGVYIEVAEMVAKNMNRPTEYLWYPTYYVRKAIRDTLLDGHCDIYLGMPFSKGFMGKKLGFTQPIIKIGYGLVMPKAMAVKSAEDFAGKKVGVLYATVAASIIARVKGAEAVTFDAPEEAMAALANQEIDLAFIWGPSAGYYNLSKLNSAYKVIPVAGKTLNYNVAMALRAVDQQLRLDLSRELRKIKDQIPSIATKYGFPDGAPLNLGHGFFEE